MQNSTTLPGTFISIEARGCLITGPSQIGKSELALSLIDRGHALVSDDVTEFHKNNNDEIIGQAPELLKKQCHIRDIGIINVVTLFGQNAWMKSKKLSLIITLSNNPKAKHEVSLQPKIEFSEILGVSIPKLSINTQHQDIALIVETSVKNVIMAQLGDNAAEQFVNKCKYSEGSWNDNRG